MLIHRLALAPLLVACLSLFAVGCDDDDDIDDLDDIPGSSLLVVNDSGFVFTELFLTEVDNPSWGDNLLFGDVLLPGEEIVLGIPCNVYDALIVEETGVECQVLGIDLCLNDATWILTNETCDVFGAKDPGTPTTRLDASRATTAARAP